MPTDRWRRVDRIFTDALEQPVSLRADFLDRACGADTDLRLEIASLLTAVEQSGDFIATPALDLFARQISREGWSVQPGDRIASYTIQRRLGAGGMGEVWRARDDRLGRDVAIKLLLPHPSDSAERVRAFQQEARAAGGLNHVNVLTVHDVGDHGGVPYLVTECLEGESLRAGLGAGPVPVAAALDIALQVARGLRAAHEHGIVHRDLKPENIFVTVDGRVKVLDFGLATLHDASSCTSPSPDPGVRIAPSPAAGTPGYMAPEQVSGETVDRRADIFALGAVLYEMLAGRRASDGDGTRTTVHASLTPQPADLSGLNPAIPAALSQIVRRCMAESADERFATMTDLESAIEAVIRERNRPAPPGILALVRRPAVMAIAVLVVFALAVGVWRSRVSASRAHWVRAVAAPEIQRLVSVGDFANAFVLAHQALEAFPDDPQVKQLWSDVSLPVVITTDPAGADVAFAAYRSPTGWFALGRTPLEAVRIPRALIRLRISKPGFEPFEGTGSPGALPRYQLDRLHAGPPGMVHVVGGRDPVRFGAIGELDDFWIDRFETTNRQFKAFVDQNGYGQRGYWREPFVDGGRTMPWEDAVSTFRDATGRPGPATWKAGTYPDGEADLPVGGVSWYEAAAYAVFAGKSLPTMYHWFQAANLGRYADILTVSNFSGKGPAAVGRYDGLGAFGTYDMAGNVKEWCWNETNEGRFLLGGAWNEPRYLFGDYDARAPFERAPGYGFRLAKYIRPLPAAVSAPVRIETLGFDAELHAPVADDIFAVYRRQYAYDRFPLNAAVEAMEESELWLKYTVAFDAAYGGERVKAYLFLPRNGSAPYQTIVFFPGSDAFHLRHSSDMSLAFADFIIRSGRALLYPVYKGTYERSTHREITSTEERELRIAWSRDLGRAIDYLETRSDIDRTRLAFYGLSSGADAGVILTALEPRLKASVLQGTGIEDMVAPEIDPLNYAPRVRMPTLMLNGRYDFGAPIEKSQRPLFELLGAAAADKQHTVVESGHALAAADAAREILPWLDRYLGPVVQPSPATAPAPSPRSR